MPILNHAAELKLASTDKAVRASVCVIGSGPAGAIVAVELAARGYDIVVLEAGGEVPDHRIDTTLDNVEVSGNIDLRFGLSHQLGGATNLWSGRLTPFLSIDFERRDWVPGSGWPIDGTELEPFYRRAADILGIPGHTHFASDVQSFISSDTIEILKFQWARKPFHAGEYLKSAAARLDNLLLVLNAPVIRLIERDTGASVEAVEVALPETESRISQIHSKAILRLRVKMRAYYEG